MFDDAVGGERLDGQVAIAAAGLGDQREDDSKRFEQIAGSSYGAPIVSRSIRAGDGQGWRKIFKPLELGFVQPREELSGVGREAFDVSTLAFGIEGVEG